MVKKSLEHRAVIRRFLLQGSKDKTWMEKHSALDTRNAWDAESKVGEGERRKGNTSQILQARQKGRSGNGYLLLDVSAFDLISC